MIQEKIYTLANNPRRNAFFTARFERELKALTEELEHIESDITPPKVHINTDILKEEVALLFSEKENSFRLRFGDKRGKSHLLFSVDKSSYAGIRMQLPINLMQEFHRTKNQYIESLGFVMPKGDADPYLEISEQDFQYDFYHIKGIIARLLLDVYQVELDQTASIIWERAPM